MNVWDIMCWRCENYARLGGGPWEFPLSLEECLGENDVQMMKMTCAGSGGGVPLGICSFMYFIVGGCILCAGDVCKWGCA